MARQLASEGTIKNMAKAIHAFNQRFAVAYKQEVARYKSEGLTENPLTTSPILASYQAVIQDINSKVTGNLVIDTYRGTIKESKANIELLTNNYLEGVTNRAYAVRNITSTLKETTTTKIVTDILVSAEGLKDGADINKFREKTEKEVKKLISKRGKKAFNEKIKGLHQAWAFIRERNKMIDALFAYYYDSEGLRKALVNIDWNPMPHIREWEQLRGRQFQTSEKDTVDFVQWLINGKPNEKGEKTEEYESGSTLKDYFARNSVDYGNDEGMIKKG